MDFLFVDEATGLFRWKGLVERGWFVSAEVVLNQHNLLGVGIQFIDQMANGFSVVFGRALGGDQRPTSGSASINTFPAPLRSYSSSMIST